MPIEALHRIQIEQVGKGVDIRSSVKYATGFQENYPSQTYGSLESARKNTIVKTLAWMAMEKINQGISLGGTLILAWDISDILMHSTINPKHAIIGIGAAAIGYAGNLVKADSGEEATRNSQLVESIVEIRDSQLSSLDRTKPYILD